jgi:hypothetical protein
MGNQSSPSMPRQAAECRQSVVAVLPVVVSGA